MPGIARQLRADSPPRFFPRRRGRRLRSVVREELDSYRQSDISTPALDIRRPHAQRGARRAMGPRPSPWSLWAAAARRVAGKRRLAQLLAQPARAAAGDHGRHRHLSSSAGGRVDRLCAVCVPGVVALHAPHRPLFGADPACAVASRGPGGREQLACRLAMADKNLSGGRPGRESVSDRLGPLRRQRLFREHGAVARRPCATTLGT